MTTIKSESSNIPKAPSGRPWERALLAYGRGEMHETIQLIKLIESKKKLNPDQQAVLATAYVGVSDRLAAKAAFEQVLRDTNGGGKPEREYVNKYARVYLALIDGSRNVDELISEAMAVNCNRIWKGLLPLLPDLLKTYDYGEPTVN
jgi:hypothetical protein